MIIDEVKVTERDWAGHLIFADACWFRRNTLLEYKDKKWIVSTVGAMPANKYSLDKSENGFTTIGFGRYYETMAFDISNSGDLADAFQKITNEITIVEPQPPTEVGEDIRLSGYITYTAPIGEYMEVKDVRCIIYQDIVFTEKTKSADGLAYTFSGMVDSPVYGTQSLSDIQIQVIEEDGRQIMTIKIPASVIPMRSNTIQLKSTLPEDIRSHETEDWKPMRIVYSVGLASNINRDTLSGVSPDYIENATRLKCVGFLLILTLIY